ncbi:MAG: iron-containing alcohol dehydrogenase [Solirubrobacterales bacterium]|nr:iron-containing alcohol dehydrogenase [Solirubrobacterales bacterium]
MSGETTAQLKYDPTDMPGLLSAVREWPDADRVPSIELERVIVDRGAIEQLPVVLESLSPSEVREAIVVCDHTPIARRGAPLKPAVRELLERAGWTAESIELSGGEREEDLHATFEAVDAVKSRLRPGVPVVALGSGTITNITKHACFSYAEETGADSLPLVFCPTADSVLAFAAAMAVISQAGVKRTWPSRLSNVLVMDLETLAEAPRRMTIGGIGDLCPVFTSFADWHLGDVLGLASTRVASWNILEDVRSYLGLCARELGAGTETGLELLSKLIVLGGLSATFAGESAPLSGYEHVTGHMLDMGAEHFKRGIASHGSQVAVALIPHAIAYEHLLARLEPGRVDVSACYPSFEQMEARVKSTFEELDPSGAMGAECWEDYSTKLRAWHEARPRFEAFLEGWSSHRRTLAELTSPARTIVETLAAAGHPLRFEELDPAISETEARWAFEHAHLMRKRFSAGDLLFYLGWLDERFTTQVFEQMHQLIAGVRGHA